MIKTTSKNFIVTDTIIKHKNTFTPIIEYINKTLIINTKQNYNTKTEKKIISDNINFANKNLFTILVK